MRLLQRAQRDIGRPQELHQEKRRGQGQTPGREGHVQQVRAENRGRDRAEPRDELHLRAGQGQRPLDRVLRHAGPAGLQLAAAPALEVGEGGEGQGQIEDPVFARFIKNARDLAAAWTYVDTHPEEIENAIQANRDA